MKILFVVYLFSTTGLRQANRSIYTTTLGSTVFCFEFLLLLKLYKLSGMKKRQWLYGCQFGY